MRMNIIRATHKDGFPEFKFAFDSNLFTFGLGWKYIEVDLVSVVEVNFLFFRMTWAWVNDKEEYAKRMQELEKAIKEELAREEKPNGE